MMRTYLDQILEADNWHGSRVQEHFLQHTASMTSTITQWLSGHVYHQLLLQRSETLSFVPATSDRLLKDSTAFSISPVTSRVLVVHGLVTSSDGHDHQTPPFSLVQHPHSQMQKAQIWDARSSCINLPTGQRAGAIVTSVSAALLSDNVRCPIIDLLL